MGRGNKNTAVAALIKEQILSAASRLFIEKGFSASRIDDISAMSGYSRRTIYAYFESKEDILDHITVKGLSALLGDIRSAAASDRDITGRWLDICGAMLRYKAKYPTSDRGVEASSPDKLTEKELSPARKEILQLGSEINDLLAGFIRDGISSGEVSSPKCRYMCCGPGYPPSPTWPGQRAALSRGSSGYRGKIFSNTASASF